MMSVITTFGVAVEGEDMGRIPCPHLPSPDDGPDAAAMYHSIILARFRRVLTQPARRDNVQRVARRRKGAA